MIDWALMTAETCGANGLTLNANSEMPRKKLSDYFSFQYFKFAKAQNEVTAERVL